MGPSRRGPRARWVRRLTPAGPGRSATYPERVPPLLTTHPMALAVDEWRAREAAYQHRMDAWLEPHRKRRRDGVAHPVLDFLFTYYSETPGRLRRWHPGSAGPSPGRRPASGWAGRCTRRSRRPRPTGTRW